MKNLEKYTLENKLFNLILKVCIAISFFSVIGNYISKLPPSLNLKWLLLTIVCFLMLRLIKYETEMYYAKIGFCLFILLVMVPCGWIESGGSNNNPLAYTFIIMICISFFFQGNIRHIMLGVLIAVSISLYSIEYFFPNVMYQHSVESKFIDHLVQIPLTLGAGYILINRFANAYYNEKEMLKDVNEELKYLANHDSLTGMYNRRMFDKEFNKIFESKLYRSEDICIILFDIDHFKHFNDTYGHEFGDIIICELATISVSVMPKKTIIARWGGDEFAMIVFDRVDNIIDYINNLYTTFHELDFEEVKQATISMGITQIKFNDTKNQVFKRVDQALYNSKDKGKNQYTIL